MKKIVIITTLVFAAAVAQAQVPNVEVRIADAGFKGLLAQRKSTSKEDVLYNAVERQVSKSVATKQTQAKNQKEVAPKKATTQAATPAPQKDSQKNVASKHSVTAAQLIKTIFLGGPFPEESAEAYHRRLSAQAYAAVQPYKSV